MIMNPSRLTTYFQISTLFSEIADAIAHRILKCLNVSLCNCLSYIM